MLTDLSLKIVIKKTVAAYGLQRFFMCQIMNYKTYSQALVSSATGVP